MTAALLHDVVDDTRVDIGEVAAAFGADAATLVATVTRLSQMNQLMRRKARKAREQVVAPSSTSIETHPCSGCVCQTDPLNRLVCHGHEQIVWYAC